MIIYFFDATLLNPVWGHCAILIRSLVEPWDPIENVSKMCWLGYMRSKLCRRAVDDVAASTKFVALATLAHLLMFFNFMFVIVFPVFANFFASFFASFFGTGSELWRWRAMCCM